jgi:flagellar biosynthesis protein FlhB
MEPKRFPPTARRIQQARDEGHTPTSAITTKAVTLLSIGVTLLYFLPEHLTRMQDLMRPTTTPQALELDDLLRHLSLAWSLFLDLIVAPLLVGWVTTIGMSLMQAGNAPFFRPIRPSWRWTPPFGATPIQHLLVLSSLALCAIVGSVIYLAALTPYAPPGRNQGEAFVALAHWLRASIYYPIGGLLLIASADLVWQRSRYRASLWMTHTELRDEERSQTLPKPVRARMVQEQEDTISAQAGGERHSAPSNAK